MASRARRRVGVVGLLDDPVAGEVQGLRRALGDRSIPRIDPHLTLVPPFNLREDDLPAALAVLRRAASACPAPIELTVGPVATFAPANSVLYLAVGGDVEALGTLRDRVHVAPLHRASQWPWVPHVTVADGVEPARIPDAVAALAAFQLSISLDRVVLLELREGKWGPLADAAFGPPARVGTGGLALELTRSRLVDPEAAALLPVSGANCSPRSGGQLAGDIGRRTGRRAPIVVTARRGEVPCGLGVAWLDDNGGHIGVFVAPAERAQGIGRHMVAALESAVSGAGWECRTMEAHGPARFYAAVSARSRVALEDR